MTLQNVLQLHEIDKLVATCGQVDGPGAQIVVWTGDVEITLLNPLNLQYECGVYSQRVYIKLKYLALCLLPLNHKTAAFVFQMLLECVNVNLNFPFAWFVADVPRSRMRFVRYERFLCINCFCFNACNFL